jgi:hypothetical protein
VNDYSAPLSQLFLGEARMLSQKAGVNLSRRAFANVMSQVIASLGILHRDEEGRRCIDLLSEMVSGRARSHKPGKGATL